MDINDETLEIYCLRIDSKGNIVSSSTSNTYQKLIIVYPAYLRYFMKKVIVAFTKIQGCSKWAVNIFSDLFPIPLPRQMDNESESDMVKG